MVQLLRILYRSRLPRDDNFQYRSVREAEGIFELEYICHSDVMQPSPSNENSLPHFLCFLLLWYTFQNFPHVQLANHGPTKFFRLEYYTRANLVVAPHCATSHCDAGRIEVYKDGAVRKAPYSDAMYITRLLHYWL